MKTGEVQTRCHRRFLGPIGETALGIIGQQLGERIHCGLPGLGRGRPLTFLFESLGAGNVRQDAMPGLAGKSGLAAFRKFIRSAKLGVPDVAVPREEFRLAFDGLVELSGRLGELTRRKELLGFHFHIASLLPKRGRFKAA